MFSESKLHPEIRRAAVGLKNKLQIQRLFMTPGAFRSAVEAEREGWLNGWDFVSWDAAENAFFYMRSERKQISKEEKGRTLTEEEIIYWVALKGLMETPRLPHGSSRIELQEFQVYMPFVDENGDFLPETASLLTEEMMENIHTYQKTLEPLLTSLEVGALMEELFVRQQAILGEADDLMIHEGVVRKIHSLDSRTISQEPALTSIELENYLALEIMMVQLLEGRLKGKPSHLTDFWEGRKKAEPVRSSGKT